MKRAGIALIVCLLVLVGFTATQLRAIDVSVERVADPFSSLEGRPAPAVDLNGDGDPVNLLLLATDTRLDTSTDPSWREGAGRTDVMILAQISGDRNHVNVMSLPRDAWVEIPGEGEAKINAAFAFGGPSLAVATVEQLVGVRIDHLALVNFDSFAVMTDALGGVEITLPQGMDTLSYEKDTNGDWKELHLEPGTHLLDGEYALAYARQRNDVPGGDLGRVQRQQNWIRAITQAVDRERIHANPFELFGFVKSVSGNIAVDEGLSAWDILILVFSMREVRPPDVVYLTAPVGGYGTSSDGQAFVTLDDAKMAALSKAFVNDEVAGFLAANPETVAVLDKDPA